MVSLIAARGYPTRDQDEQLAQLSVDHARTLGYYREAHEIYQRHQQGRATTEDLRQALVHYRALFADLLGAEPVGHRDPAADRAAADRTADPAADRAADPAQPASRAADHDSIHR